MLGGIFVGKKRKDLKFFGSKKTDTFLVMIKLFFLFF